MARSMTNAVPTLASPVFCGDFMGREQLLPGGAKVDAAQFAALGAVVAVVGAAGAAQGATSVPVAALSGAIPSGTVLDFGAAKFARLTADAAAGATSLTVAALPTALVSTDTATYQGNGIRSIPAGTIVGRTIAERDASTPFGAAVSTDDEIMIVAFDVTDATDINDVELLRQYAGVLIKENFLPGWASVAGALKTAVRARYVCVRGAE